MFDLPQQVGAPRDFPRVALPEALDRLAAMPAMLLDVRRLAAQRGIPSVTWHAPARADVEAALHTSAFVSRWDGSAYIYEKRA